MPIYQPFAMKKLIDGIKLSIGMVDSRMGANILSSPENQRNTSCFSATDPNF
jgi:hypothetical protein